MAIATSQIPTATNIVIGRPILGLSGLIMALYLEKKKNNFPFKIWDNP